MPGKEAPFIKPDDFVPLKGGKYACKLCVPEGKARGVPMQLAAALRHERTCEKHLEKVKEAIINDWAYQPGYDWGPVELPKGSTAWEESYPADRAEDFILHWMNNVEAAERDEPMEPMDSFIDRFNAKHAEWLRKWKQESGEWKEAQDKANAQEEPAEEWEGVQGWWYSGGSFDPREEGPPPPPAQQSLGPLAAEAKQMWGHVSEDPYEVWGISRDEVTPWTDVPAPVQQGSDATPLWPSVPRRSPKPRRNGRAKGHGRGQLGDRRQVVDGANGCPRDGRKMKIH
ncbi:hypothetical protein K466DRAFT_650864 [Polyporus arcularius HHB13444]|uniref:Uncharacterized protein n=1 Tax=Polyporus arcularius HHB13444 TaxID=1314778 RepID=A0A5C3PST1_9APHY|nr:hypothetical protein K466DRAFT_650864 [Polyporus arcularius HHB13444]